MHDVAEFVRDDGVDLVLVKELEDALGQDDPRIAAAAPVGECGGIAVADDADARRLEAVLCRHPLQQRVHRRIALGDGRCVEELHAVEPAQ